MKIRNNTPRALRTVCDGDALDSLFCHQYCVEKVRIAPPKALAKAATRILELRQGWGGNVVVPSLRHLFFWAPLLHPALPPSIHAAGTLPFLTGAEEDSTAWNPNHQWGPGASQPTPSHPTHPISLRPHGSKGSSVVAPPTVLPQGSTAHTPATGSHPLLPIAFIGTCFLGMGLDGAFAVSPSPARNTGMAARPTIPTSPPTTSQP